MSPNQIKKTLRQLLPRALFDTVQKVRRGFHRPDPFIATLKARHDELQQGNKNENEMALRQGLTIRVHPESRMPFSWFCWQSPEMVAELDLFLELVEGMHTFADIGANHGVFSLAFLKRNPLGKVLSVDPSPIADEIRRANFTLNGMSDSTICRMVACGDQEGTVRMHANWHHLEASGRGDADAVSVDVPVRSLDTLCQEEGLRPQLVKIDVEGFELRVLEGAEKVLSNADVLLLEIHPELLEKLDSKQGDIFDWLTRRGWDVFDLRGSGIDRAQFIDQIHTFWTLCRPARR